MNMWNFLQYRGIEVHNKYVAIESASKLNISADGYREVIREMLDLKPDDVSGVGDQEARRTLSYLLEQAFDPMADMDLETAQIKALDHIKKFPYSLAKSDPTLDKDGNLIAVEVNEDGVALNAKGKPKKGYKKEMALRLWREHKDTVKNRQAWIALFVENIPGMVAGTASTYIHCIENGKWT